MLTVDKLPGPALASADFHDSLAGSRHDLLLIAIRAAVRHTEILLRALSLTPPFISEFTVINRAHNGERRQQGQCWNCEPAIEM